MVNGGQFHWYVHSTYKTWFKQYKEEKAELEMALSGRAKAKDSNEAIFEHVLPWMSNLLGIYDKCTISETFHN